MSVSLDVRTKLLKQMSSLLLGTAVLALAAHAAVPNASFNAPRSFAVPYSPTAVAVGDLNGDGKPDMVVAGGGYVSILLGNGDGAFAPAVNYAVGDDARSVAIADFNGDGKPDLAVANYGSVPATVSILLGNGDGTFQPQVSYAVGSAASPPDSLAVADFNRDGKADLAVYASIGGDVYILLGTGDGGFQAGVAYPTCGGQGYSYEIAIGDFNGDGNPDVVGTCGDVSVAILLGNGDGTLQPPVTYSKGLLANIVSVAVGDFDGDGVADLAVAADGRGAQPGCIFILLGNGNGTFQYPVKYALGFVDAVAVGDFNGDGKADLAVAGTGNISILLGNGDGSFQPPTAFAAAEHPNENPAQPLMAVGDFNGDGALDVAVMSMGSVSVLLGNGQGGFPQPITFPTGKGESWVAVGDFNGDGKPDLAVTGESSGSVAILLGNGNGTFQAPVSYAAGRMPIFVAVGDFNGDGKPDLVIVNSDANEISVLLGNGDGSFRRPAHYAAGSGPLSIAIGDFNGDGKLDLAVATAGAETVAVLLGKGDGTFLPYVTYPAGGISTFVAVGDFNGDGNADLAVSECGEHGHQCGISILMGNGSGGFAAPVIHRLEGVGEGAGGVLAVADFNGDGHQDLAVANTGTTISILLGKGDGTFRPQVSYAFPFGIGRMVVGDFNGDGVPDLATADGSVAMLLGNGDGTFTVQAVAYVTGAIGEWLSLASGDFNGDGRIDLAVAPVRAGLRTVAILTNTTP
jgi:VCBS repeat protein/FG-GAP repeat protein